MTEVGTLPLQGAGAVHVQRARKLTSHGSVLGMTACVTTAGALLSDCPVCTARLVHSACPVCSACLVCSACSAAAGHISSTTGKFRVAFTGPNITSRCDCAGRVSCNGSGDSLGCNCTGRLMCVPEAAAVSHFGISAGSISDGPGRLVVSWG